MAEITANQIVKLFEENISARKRLAELLVIEPDVRLAIINAVLRDVATKNDINTLRNEMRDEIGKLRNEISDLKRDIEKLNERTSRLEGQVNLLIKIFITFNLPILIAIIGILLKLIF